MTSAGDSFSWPFQDPGWFGKMILQGLINIIPIIGQIALLGWMQITIDNYRAGRKELAPAGFHLSRGIALWVVFYVYLIVLFIPGGIFNQIGTASNSGAFAALGSLLYLAALVVLFFLAPAIFLNTYRNGFGGGFDVLGVWRLATGNASTTVVAGLIMLVASIISGLGIIICFVGLLFTVPYSYAIIAGVITWYEQALAGPAPMPTQPA